MLFRNIDNHYHHHQQQQDQDIFFTMSSSYQYPPGNDPTAAAAANANYQFHEEVEDPNSNLDDIWEDTTSHHHHHADPSDIPRLRQEHTTAGYRDGIAQAKSQTVQPGFDEGFGLGATVGARAGQLLGLLEGLAAAVGLRSLASPVPEESKRIEALLSEARRELSVQSVFGKEYWGEDGTWSYEVREGGEKEEEEEEEEVVFADVASAHPLIRKWDGIVRGEAAGYGVDWEVFKDEDRECLRGEEERARREVVRGGKVDETKMREVEKGLAW